jgi:hypothetical protein
MSVSAGWRGPNIVGDGLVLYMDAGSPSSYLTEFGTTWKDVSGNGNTGTLINGPTYSTGSGGTIIFDGTNDYASLGNILNYTSENFTFSYWINAANISNSPVVFWKGAYSVNGYYHQISSDGSIAFVVNQPGSFQYTQSTSANIIINTWSNIAVVRNGTSVKFYKNGVELAYGVVGTLSNPASNTNNFLLSTYFDGSSNNNFLNGRIANFLNYNRILSLTEIQQNYNASKARFGLS